MLGKWSVITPTMGRWEKWQAGRRLIKLGKWSVTTPTKGSVAGG